MVPDLLGPGHDPEEIHQTRLKAFVEPRHGHSGGILDPWRWILQCPPERRVRFETERNAQPPENLGRISPHFDQRISRRGIERGKKSVDIDMSGVAAAGDQNSQDRLRLQDHPQRLRGPGASRVFGSSQGVAKCSEHGLRLPARQLGARTYGRGSHRREPLRDQVCQGDKQPASFVGPGIA